MMLVVQILIYPKFCLITVMLQLVGQDQRIYTEACVCLHRAWSQQMCPTNQI